MWLVFLSAVNVFFCFYENQPSAVEQTVARDCLALYVNALYGLSYAVQQGLAFGRILVLGIIVHIRQRVHVSFEVLLVDRTLREI